jgi:cell wall-associated NlpC family hydrolase
MTRAQVVIRARSACGQGCAYALGKGGANPARSVPWGEEKSCDCSGLVCWALGRHRMIWLDTSGIVSLAIRPPFVAVPLADAQTGDLLVYPDRTDSSGQHRQGHVGIVSEAGITSAEKAVHCSLGNWRRESDAILETGVDLWITNPGTIVARPTFLEDV